MMVTGLSAMAVLVGAEFGFIQAKLRTDGGLRNSRLAVNS